jgi:hypothetical protein
MEMIESRSVLDVASGQAHSRGRWVVDLVLARQ